MDLLRQWVLLWALCTCMISADINLDGILRNWCWDLCGWTQWRSWTRCDQTCGGGTRQRTRSLCAWVWLDTLRKKLDHCGLSASDLYQHDTCNTICAHGEWSAFDKECKCQPGWTGYCCNEEEERGEWLEWGPWSTCSRSCGGGEQTRSRACFDFNTGQNAQSNFCGTTSLEMRVCNEEECPSATTQARQTPRATTSAPPATILQFTKHLVNISVYAGENAVLECSTRPVTTITWSHNDVILIGTSPLLNTNLLPGPHGVLIISALEALHVGKYKCVAELNGQVIQSVGWISSPDVQTCDIDFSERPQNATVPLGSLKMLPCLPSVQHTTTHWYKDGVPVVYDNVRLQKLVNGYLLIRQAATGDHGKYTCELRNSECSVNASAWIQVYSTAQEICGQPVINEPSLRQGHIVGGQDAAVGSAPWMVMLYERNAHSFCGGVLLNENWVLTAAHCFHDFNAEYRYPLNSENLELKLGKYDRTTREPQERTYRMSLYRVHEGFNSHTYDNDIALIKLRTRVEFTDYIRPICWNHTGHIINALLREEGNQVGTVTGWGRLTERGQIPRYLNEVRLPLVDRITCRNSATRAASVTDNMFCAGYKREVVGDACRGDSGGPFIMRLERSTLDPLDYDEDEPLDDDDTEFRWHLLGLVSWGEGCAQPGKYGFYTKVENYKDWILSKM